MKGFHIVVLLSSAVLRVSAAPAPELVTCGEEGGPAAARLAMHRINENHDHGYKFRLQKIQSHGVEKVDGGCNLELQLNLLETAVMANCTVQFSIRNNDANLTKYECDTRQEAVSKFNQNTTNQHYYILKEVGRIRVGHVLGLGMHYYTEFELVETHCPMGSRINPEACQPLCPDRAHHAFCQSSYSNATGLKSVACDFYPPSNTTALGPGEQEPLCRHHGGGHPPHAVAMVAVIMAVMAKMTRKSSIMGPHSVPNNTSIPSIPSIPSIAAVDQTQLSTPFAPGLVL
ncbi:hypothetical protein FQN60_013237, partial [Etheostoma spectabile]